MVPLNEPLPVAPDENRRVVFSFGPHPIKIDLKWLEKYPELNGMDPLFHGFFPCIFRH